MNEQNQRDSIMSMARGAFEERVDYEMDKVIQNILDPNTKATALYVTSDGNGELVVAEMVPQVPGQMNMDGTQQEAPKLLKLVQHG